MPWVKVSARPQHGYRRFCYISKVRHSPVRVWVPDHCSCSLIQHNNPSQSFPANPDATKIGSASVGILCSCWRCCQRAGCYKSTGDPHHWPVGCDKSAPLPQLSLLGSYSATQPAVEHAFPTRKSRESQPSQGNWGARNLQEQQGKRLAELQLNHSERTTSSLPDAKETGKPSWTRIAWKYLSF